MLRSLAAERHRANGYDSASPSSGASGGGSTAMGRGRTNGAPPMAKSNPVDETRIADPVKPAKRPPRATAKKAGGTAKAQKRRTRSKGAVGSRNGTKPASGKQTKQQTCLDLLGRREGATIEDLQQATDWQKHMCAASWLGRSERSSASHSIGEARRGTPPLSHPDHGLNAIDRNVLAEHNGRRRRGGERRGSPR